MAIGVIGRKAGMTRIFNDDGQSIPVTVIEVQPNRVTQAKTDERDGYRAVQVTTGRRRKTRVTQPLAGHYAKVGVEPGTVLREFRLEPGEGEDLTDGAELNVSLFEVGQKVDVRGVTIGRGFTGTIRRHHFRGQDSTHGNSLSHRAPGSIGQCQTPGRVVKGKKMAGQMGNVNRCQQNLEVIRVDAERNLLLIRGGVPGPAGGRLVVVPSVKQKNRKG
ncbi:50S ribosomal protein L3 [Lamprobacter modestohalophilus]|uniref:Large ribosomal subunit protein uL3 n=1 Tax=Lamprobacter modestohalophilus TaxID=1064514 RepID=A0A9X0W897_9GAMM|nr:50S ribosomal protein L3 [Lamprobacter modestohalophilus]MBK1618093.1 50S ribosomal protein L3 [Lamprobacter modestohalophilus]MCF7976539.1 50S ribosomal protein L3 [Chromatiaceae bacterium]MCF8016883.1 50S ribosomal protein L3 [Chromatiaceae bacterium]